ncbi:MAG: hypothetical protein Q9M36_04030 [Sulfurovum sp.]|nr:hypothetical protein [Sulfurovum sp.]
MTKVIINKSWIKLSAIILTLLLLGCTSIAPFNQIAYEKATSVKARSMLLMSKATQPYTTHKDEIAILLLEAQQGYEYAKGRPKNQQSSAQWAIILSPQRHSLGGFLHKWKLEKTLSSFYIQEAQKLIGRHFDYISSLESGKINKP